LKTFVKICVHQDHDFQKYAFLYASILGVFYC